MCPPTAQLNFNTLFNNYDLEWKEIYSLPFPRPRIVPLSHSPLCVTRRKTERTKSGRVISWGEMSAKRGLDYRLSQWVWIMRFSHNAKIWHAVDIRKSERCKDIKCAEVFSLFVIFLLVNKLKILNYLVYVAIVVIYGISGVWVYTNYPEICSLVGWAILILSHGFCSDFLPPFFPHGFFLRQVFSGLLLTVVSV